MLRSRQRVMILVHPGHVDLRLVPSEDPEPIDEGGSRGFGPSGAGLFITPYLISKSFEIDAGGSRGFGPSGAGLFIRPYLISKSFEIDAGGSRGFGPSGAGLFITPYLISKSFEIDAGGSRGFGPSGAGLFITPYLISKSFEIDTGGSRGFGPSGAGVEFGRSEKDSLVKCNVDASLLANLMGFGAVLRDQKGILWPLLVEGCIVKEIPI
nr:ankyrin repeat domain-containing protein 50-like [Ipomoea batatas]